MSAGATYAVTPFVRRDSVGAVTGIVGAGGNVGAVLAGFLFRSDGFPPESAFLVLGIAVLCASALVLSVRFKAEDEALSRREIDESSAGERLPSSPVAAE
jgi:MFS transporter, NNP family, nitrate/nitrite transporter